jgi:Zn-dependent protease
MLLAEPPPSQADLEFRAFGVPVRVHPFFWLACLLTSGALSGGPPDVPGILLWAVVLFVSILVHELGHAAAQIYFGGRPWVVLYGYGGLAICGDCDRRPASQIIISFAGPLAGFLLAGLVVSLLFALGNQPQWSLSGERGGMWIGVGYFGILPFKFGLANTAVAQLLFINILWGLVNLLPIYPLDGGRISRELFTLSGNPQVGIENSLWLSLVAAAVVAFWGLRQEDFFIAIMFGLLAFNSFQILQSYGRFGGGRW